LNPTLVGNIMKTFPQRLLEWFSSNARDFPWRNETDPYRILIAEKLLQQTTYGHVLKVYEVFFEKFPDIQSLAKAEVSDIENTIRRLGFQRQRAKQFKKMSLQIISSHRGKIPPKKQDLLRLDGIGEYVANAVLCFAFREDLSVVDMNVRRVVQRYFGWNKTKDSEIEQRLRRMIPKGKAKQFNWGIIDFSALICSRKPKCKTCFLSGSCDYFRALVGK
jgi:A/G-specific adenine glycosylase